MLVTFGATFFGVIASFLLWFGGQWWIKRQHNKRAVKAMMQEIQEEIQLNIAILDQFSKTAPKMLKGGNVPVYIPYRMNLAVYNYVVSTGEIRLINDIRKQRLIRYAALACETFNKFIDNTEVLLAIFLLRSDGLVWSGHRLKGLIESADDNRKYLEDILSKLRRDDLEKEHKEKKDNGKSKRGSASL
jgi:hypothetical protein